MHSRAFLFLLLCLTILVILTSPPVLGELLTAAEPSPSPTPVPPTATPTATATPDPLASVPIATPLGQGGVAMGQSLPAPSLGQLPPTFTPSPVLPTATLTTSQVVTTSVPPTPGSLPHVIITPSPTAVGGGSDDGGGDVGAPGSTVRFPASGTVVSAILPMTSEGGTAVLLIGGLLGLLSAGGIVWAVAVGRREKTKEHTP
jgi:hypothetical protein